MHARQRRRIRSAVWSVLLAWSFVLGAATAEEHSPIAAVLEGATMSVEDVDPQVLEFFTRMNRALRDDRPRDVMQLMDGEAMFSESAVLLSDFEVRPEVKRGVVENVVPSIAYDMCRPEFAMAWTEMRIKAVQPLGDPDRVAVTVRQWDKDRIATKSTWYLRLHDNRYRVFDLDQLDMGVRWSVMLAVGLRAGADARSDGGFDQGLESLMLMYGGMLTFAEGDVDSAKKQLDAVSLDHLPVAMHSLVHEVRGIVSTAEADFETALEHLDQARLSGLSPFGHLTRATSLYVLGENQEALAEADLYARQAGVDADVLSLVGDIYADTGRNDGALMAYSRALDDDPYHEGALMGFLHTLPDDRKKKFVARFRSADFDAESACRFTESFKEFFRDESAVTLLDRLAAELKEDLDRP